MLHPPWRALPLPDADLRLWVDFLPPHEADALLDALTEAIPWQRDEVRVFGRIHPIPRLHRWYGPPGTTYTWSGLTQVSPPWPPVLLHVQARVVEATGHPFNAVLANLYRDGDDTMGWHADDEPELGPAPAIASLSLGAARDFQLRHRRRPDLGTTTVNLLPGSLLWMGPPTQTSWQHAVPRRRRVHDPRLNLTFRRMILVG